MIIYPDIEILDGKCVNLRSGYLEQPINFEISPLEAALAFERQGADILHIVDLDGVLQGGKHNGDPICEIIDKVNIPVQVGGGIRTFSAAHWWFDHGAERIVLGTAAVLDSRFLLEVCQYYPGRVLASVDAYEGKVMTHGWRETTVFTPLEVGMSLQDSGISAIIYTDIDMDIDIPEATLASTTIMAEELSVPVISTGTIKSLDDVSRLQLLPNIAGVIIGRALFNKSFSLEDALAISKQAKTEAELI